MVKIFKQILSITLCLLLIITGISADDTTDISAETTASDSDLEHGSGGSSFTPTYSYWDWVADSDNWTFIKFLYQKYLDKSEDDAIKLSGGGGSTRGGGAGRRFSKSDISDLNGAYNSFVSDQAQSTVSGSGAGSTLDSTVTLTPSEFVDYRFNFGASEQCDYVISSPRMFLRLGSAYSNGFLGFRIRQYRLSKVGNVITYYMQDLLDGNDNPVTDNRYLYKESSSAFSGLDISVELHKDSERTVNTDLHDNSSVKMIVKPCYVFWYHYFYNGDTRVKLAS